MKTKRNKDWFEHVSICAVFIGKQCDMECEQLEITRMSMGEIIDHD